MSNNPNKRRRSTTRNKAGKRPHSDTRLQQLQDAQTNARTRGRVVPRPPRVPISNANSPPSKIIRRGMTVTRVYGKPPSYPKNSSKRDKGKNTK